MRAKVIFEGKANKAEISYEEGTYWRDQRTNWVYILIDSGEWWFTKNLSGSGYWRKTKGEAKDAVDGLLPILNPTITVTEGS